MAIHSNTNCTSTLFKCLMHCTTGLLMLILLAGCGIVADKDRVVVATLDGKNITRGDLFSLIRGMEDSKRPIIKNKSDLLRVLNNHIDEQIKIPLGRKMQEDGLLNLSWEQALQQYFSLTGDQEQHSRMIWNMEIPEGDQTTPLMDVYNLTPKQIAATKAIIAQEVDFLLEKMLGEAAVLQLVKTDIVNQKVQFDQEDLEREYRLRKDQLKKLEWMRFAGLRFPTALPDAEHRAADISDRLKAGESFEEILAEFKRTDPGKVIESEIENNPGLPKFKGFWFAASGAEPGTVIGPVYLPEYTMQMQDAQGQVTAQTMPDAYIIFQVVERHDESTLSLEEAKAALLPELLLSEKMNELRAQHGVQIYTDKLPDPAQFAEEDPYAALDQVNVQ